MKHPKSAGFRSTVLAGTLACLSGQAWPHVSNIDITASGLIDNGGFTRYGWIDGTKATLGDSHNLDAGNFYVFHLNQPSFVTLSFSEISGSGGQVITNGGLDPAFSLYSGLLPPLAHDDTPYDPLFANDIDLAPLGHVYLPHDGYRDTVNYSATGGVPYFGQFDVLGDWSMANDDAVPGDPGSVPGNWAKIRYITHVNAHVTALGANLMPSGVVDDTPETLGHYPLPAGDYTIAASGAACDNLNIAGCTNPLLWGRVTFSSVPNIAPSFTGGTTSLTVPKSSPPFNLKTNLHVSDTDTGQTETWSQATAPAHGALSFSGATAVSGNADITPGGTITYTPTANYLGTDAFSVRVDDGLSNSIRSFTVNVVATNTAPSFVGGTTNLIVPQNIAAANLKPNLRISDTDASQTETWSQATAPAHGTLSFSGATAASGGTNISPGGTIGYTPAAGYLGSDTFSVQVSDGIASTSRAFTVKVRANTAPAFTSTVTNLKIATNFASNLKPLLNVSDVDNGQTETWKQQTAPAHGTLSFVNATADSGATSVAPGGTVTYTPALNYTGADSFTVRVDDGMAITPRTYNVTVGANTAPAFVGTVTALNLVQNFTSNLKPYLTVGDVDHGQIETWSQATAPSHGSLSFTSATANSGATGIAPGGAITYTPVTGYLGGDTFAIKVSDGIATTTRTFTVNVRANTAPAFVGTLTTLKLAQNFTSNLKPYLNVSDTDHGQTETWSQQAAPAHGSLSFTSATATSGTASIAPGGTIAYTPVAGYVGSDTFTVKVSDGLATATRAFTVNVGPNTAPVFSLANAGLIVAQNGPAANLKNTLPVNDIDHGQQEAWSQVTAPAHGTLSFTNAVNNSGSTTIYPGGTVTYTPTAGYSGPDSYTVRAGDGIATVSRTFGVTVQPNTAPVFTGGATSLTVAKNSAAISLKPNLLVNDVNTGQTLSWSQSIAPAHGVLAFSSATALSGGTSVTSGGTITYQPTANYTGPDNFTVQVSDGMATAVRAFSVTVQ